SKHYPHSHFHRQHNHFADGHSATPARGTRFGSREPNAGAVVQKIFAIHRQELLDVLNDCSIVFGRGVIEWEKIVLPHSVMALLQSSSQLWSLS
ncbi:MAG: hypothetical protein WB463_14570, partial [Pseudolabrys sp.]